MDPPVDQPMSRDTMFRKVLVGTSFLSACLLGMLCGGTLITLQQMRGVHVHPTKVHIDLSEERDHASISVDGEVLGLEGSLHGVKLEGGRCELRPAGKAEMHIPLGELVEVSHSQSPQKGRKQIQPIHNVHMVAQLSHEAVQHARVALKGNADGMSKDIFCSFDVDLDLYRTGFTIPYIVHTVSSIPAGTMGPGAKAWMTHAPSEVSWPSIHDRIDYNQQHRLHLELPSNDALVEFLRTTPVTIKAGLTLVDPKHDSAELSGSINSKLLHVNVKKDGSLTEADSTIDTTDEVKKDEQGKQPPKVKKDEQGKQPPKVMLLLPMQVAGRTHLGSLARAIASTAAVHHDRDEPFPEMLAKKLDQTDRSKPTQLFVMKLKNPRNPFASLLAPIIGEEFVLSAKHDRSQDTQSAKPLLQSVRRLQRALYDHKLKGTDWDSNDKVDLSASVELMINDMPIMMIGGRIAKPNGQSVWDLGGFVSFKEIHMADKPLKVHSAAGNGWSKTWVEHGHSNSEYRLLASSLKIDEEKWGLEMGVNFAHLDRWQDSWGSQSLTWSEKERHNDTNYQKWGEMSHSDIMLHFSYDDSTKKIGLKAYAAIEEESEHWESIKADQYHETWFQPVVPEEHTFMEGKWAASGKGREVNKMIKNPPMRRLARRATELIEGMTRNKAGTFTDSVQTMMKKAVPARWKHMEAQAAKAVLRASDFLFKEKKGISKDAVHASINNLWKNLTKGGGGAGKSLDMKRRLAGHRHSLQQRVSRARRLEKHAQEQYAHVGAGECSGKYIEEVRGGMTLASCASKCDGTSNCVAFALGKATGTEAGYCHLYSTAGTAGNGNPDDYDCYARQAPTSPPTPPPTPDNYYGAGDGECSGTYIEEVRGGMDLKSCTSKCDGTSNCMAFALGKTTGNEAGYCHLYSTGGRGKNNPDNYYCYEKKGPTPAPGPGPTTAAPAPGPGPTTAALAPGPGAYKYAGEGECSGGGYIKEWDGGFTQTSCARACDATSNCVAFAIGKSTGSEPGYCHVYSKPGRGESVKGAGNYDCYVKEGPMPTPAPGRGPMPTPAPGRGGYKYAGAGECAGGGYIKEWAGGFTQTSCASACDATSNCVAFALGKSTGSEPGYCHIYSKPGRGDGVRGDNYDCYVKEGPMPTPAPGRGQCMGADGNYYRPGFIACYEGLEHTCLADGQWKRGATCQDPYVEVAGKGCGGYIHMDDAEEYGIPGGSYTVGSCALAVAKLNGKHGCKGEFFFFEEAGYCNCPIDDCAGPQNNHAGSPGILYKFVAVKGDGKGHYGNAGPGECSGRYIQEWRGGMDFASCAGKCDGNSYCVAFALGRASGNEPGFCHIYSTAGRGEYNPENYDCYYKEAPSKYKYGEVMKDHGWLTGITIDLATGKTPEECIEMAKNDARCGECVALHVDGGTGDCACSYAGSGCETRDGAAYDMVYRLKPSCWDCARKASPLCKDESVSMTGKTYADLNIAECNHCKPEDPDGVIPYCAGLKVEVCWVHGESHDEDGHYGAKIMTLSAAKYSMNSGRRRSPHHVDRIYTESMKIEADTHMHEELGEGIYEGLDDEYFEHECHRQWGLFRSQFWHSPVDHTDIDVSVDAVIDIDGDGVKTGSDAVVNAELKVHEDHGDLFNMSMRADIHEPHGTENIVAEVAVQLDETPAHLSAEYLPGEGQDVVTLNLSWIEDEKTWIELGRAHIKDLGHDKYNVELFGNFTVPWEMESFVISGKNSTAVGLMAWQGGVDIYADTIWDISGEDVDMSGDMFVSMTCTSDGSVKHVVTGSEDDFAGIGPLAWGQDMNNMPMMSKHYEGRTGNRMAPCQEDMQFLMDIDQLPDQFGTTKHEKMSMDAPNPLAEDFEMDNMKNMRADAMMRGDDEEEKVVRERGRRMAWKTAKFLVRNNLHPLARHKKHYRRLREDKEMEGDELREFRMDKKMEDDTEGDSVPEFEMHTETIDGKVYMQMGIVEGHKTPMMINVTMPEDESEENVDLAFVMYGDEMEPMHGGLKMETVEDVMNVNLSLINDETHSPVISLIGHTDESAAKYGEDDLAMGFGFSMHAEVEKERDIKCQFGGKAVLCKAWQDQMGRMSYHHVKEEEEEGLSYCCSDSSGKLKYQCTVHHNCPEPPRVFEKIFTATGHNKVTNTESSEVTETHFGIEDSMEFKQTFSWNEVQGKENWEVLTTLDEINDEKPGGKHPLLKVQGKLDNVVVDDASGTFSFDMHADTEELGKCPNGQEATCPKQKEEECEHTDEWDGRQHLMCGTTPLCYTHRDGEEHHVSCRTVQVFKHVLWASGRNTYYQTVAAEGYLMDMSVLDEVEFNGNVSKALHMDHFEGTVSLVKPGPEPEAIMGMSGFLTHNEGEDITADMSVTDESGDTLVNVAAFAKSHNDGKDNKVEAKLSDGSGSETGKISWAATLIQGDVDKYAMHISAVVEEVPRFEVDTTFDNGATSAVLDAKIKSNFEEVEEGAQSELKENFHASSSMTKSAQEFSGPLSMTIDGVEAKDIPAINLKFTEGFLASGALTGCERMSWEVEVKEGSVAPLTLKQSGTFQKAIETNHICAISDEQIIMEHDDKENKDVKIVDVHINTEFPYDWGNGPWDWPPTPAPTPEPIPGPTPASQTAGGDPKEEDSATPGPTPAAVPGPGPDGDTAGSNPVPDPTPAPTPPPAPPVTTMKLAVTLASGSAPKAEAEAKASIAESLGVPAENVEIVNTNYKTKVTYKFTENPGEEKAIKAVAKAHGVPESQVQVEIREVTGNRRLQETFNAIRRLASTWDVKAEITSNEIDDSEKIHANAANLTAVKAAFEEQGVTSDAIEVKEAPKRTVEYTTKVKSTDSTAVQAPDDTQKAKLAESVGGSGASVEVSDVAVATPAPAPAPTPASDVQQVDVDKAAVFTVGSGLLALLATTWC